MIRDTREWIERMHSDCKNNAVSPVQVFDNVGIVSQAVEYFRDLDSTEITGAQVAKLFEALLREGRFPTDATDDAGLPEWPAWLL